jgi:hypothetical protein
MLGAVEFERVDQSFGIIRHDRQSLSLVSWRLAAQSRAVRTATSRQNTHTVCGRRLVLNSTTEDAQISVEVTSGLLLPSACLWLSKHDQNSDDHQPIAKTVCVAHAFCHRTRPETNPVSAKDHRELGDQKQNKAKGYDPE